ncbi:flagellar hook-basal body protein [Virgibacillus sp. YIM 98842]|uniref:flagellar hook-basal body protein n=1 Tax=Virgibacillus sp. YIM 98842 TaxID=2663533 RepID=UPI0013D95DE9|nr:flagellar hook-basal body protein [Virgibacillus sp. YIM 98842]
MSRSMIQAAVTMNQLQNKLDLIGNNLANSQTTGYKSREADFSSLLTQQINNVTHPQNAEGRLTPDGVRIGSGARLGSVNMNMALGAINETGRELDVALLQPNYFFQVEVTENGNTETRYTRDGSFYLNPINDNQDVLLTNGDGNPVLGENGPIIIAEGFDSITIQPNGQITVQRGNVTEDAGNITITEVVRPRLLEAAGENNFRLPDTAELGFELDEILQAPAGNQELLKNGALENANVDVAKQMSDLMLTQRAYQFNSRTISMGDQMMGLINQLR